MAPIGHYSDAVQAGGFLFVSGCVSMDADGNVLHAEDTAAQARAVLVNLGHVLRAAGADYHDVVRLLIFLTDIQDRTLMSPIRREFFGSTKPAATLVEVSALALPDLKVEIEATAFLPNRIKP